jgi:hypothetical protein
MEISIVDSDSPIGSDGQNYLAEKQAHFTRTWVHLPIAVLSWLPTFREHAGNTGTLSWNMRGTFRKHGHTFREHSGNIQATFRKHEHTLKEHAGSKQGASREQAGNIEGTCAPAGAQTAPRSWPARAPPAALPPPPRSRAPAAPRAQQAAAPPLPPPHARAAPCRCPWPVTPPGGAPTMVSIVHIRGE